MIKRDVPLSPLHLLRRREFLAILGSIAAWPSIARTQQRETRVVGVLLSARTDAIEHSLDPFLKGLQEAGYIAGQNLTMLYRSADGHYDRLPELAADLVRRKVDVLFAKGLPAARAAKAATSKIPIVFTSGGDPVARGLISSLNRPGANITGVTMLNAPLLAKRFELLRELKPRAKTIALLVNPKNPNAKTDINEIVEASSRLNVRLRVLTARSPQEIEQAFSSLERDRVDALLVAGDPFFALHAKRLVKLVKRVAIPASYDFRVFVDAGGLLSYGASISNALRLAGGYAGRVLHGERPALLPVQRSTKLELLVNLKTARALGLTIPPSILLRADEVIE